MGFELEFTSERSLKLSIKLKYPTLTDEQQEAVFEDQKQWIGIDVEKYLQDKYDNTS